MEENWARKGQMPGFNMVEHYTHARGLMPVTWRYSYVQQDGWDQLSQLGQGRECTITLTDIGRLRVIHVGTIMWGWYISVCLPEWKTIRKWQGYGAFVQYTTPLSLMMGSRIVDRRPSISNQMYRWPYPWSGPALLFQMLWHFFVIVPPKVDVSSRDSLAATLSNVMN